MVISAGFDSVYGLLKVSFKGMDKNFSGAFGMQRLDE
jgi:hypothetical protein